MAACSGIVCRKRARSDPDDCEECMPISKRINNLHIRHSTEAWEVLDHQAGENFNNNLPGEASCCQLSPQTSPPIGQLSMPPFSPIGGQIPGLLLDVRHQPRLPIVPDINHNNPLLSPLPRQPCPTNVNHGCYQQVTGIIENSNPYYFHINASLYQAHVDRIRRVGQGDPNT